jgi:hypothetical protein
LSYLVSAQYQQAADSHPESRAGFGGAIATLQGIAVTNRDPKERRNPMKVKTNTRAGNAMWGS